MKRKVIQLTEKKKLFKNYIGKENCDALRQRLEEAFEANTGVFIFIATPKPNGKEGLKVTDAYMGVCPCCVTKFVDRMVKDAEKHGLLPPTGKIHCN